MGGYPSPKQNIACPGASPATRASPDVYTSSCGGTLKPRSGRPRPRGSLLGGLDSVGWLGSSAWPVLVLQCWGYVGAGKLT